MPRKNADPYLSSKFAQWVFGGIVLVSVATMLLYGISRQGCILRRPSDDHNRLAYSIESFEQEYGRIPDVSSQEFESEGPEAMKLIKMLLGKEDTGATMQNPRQIAFLSIRTTKDPKQGGLVMSENKVVGIYDPWGNPYRVILHPLDQSMTTSQRGKEATKARPVVIRSKGADGKWNTKDDISSSAGEL